MSHDWKKTFISPTSTIRDALQVIDSESLRVALVVDLSQVLLGVVTDGDIRRGLLSGFSVDDPVTTVMNKEPTTADEHSTREELAALMNRLDLLAVPIVTSGKVVGLQTLHDSLVRQKKDNPIFIMAGGFGKRLRPLTDHCPKPMLTIGDKPILALLIDNFIQYGFYKFYISTHYLPEVITNYFGDGSDLGIEIHYVHEESPLGTGGALSLLPKYLPDLPLIMINGDILTRVDFDKLLRFHNEHDVVATLCVREYEYQVPFGVIESDGIYIDAMVEKPLHRFFVNAGVYVLTRNVYANVKPGQCIDMPRLLESHIAQGRQLLQFPIHEYWLDIGRMDDFKRAQHDIHLLN